MTSLINPNNIDGNYPVAGVPNNTQGFRDNFTNIQTNFQYASDEITELQNKAVLKAAITGSTLDNNMNDGLIYAVTLNDVGWTVINNTATSGIINVDYSAGQYQTITTTGNISLNFTNWPESGFAGNLILRIQITNTAHTMTLPASVSQGLIGLEGYNAGVISFGATGYYYYQFVTLDGGTSIEIADWDRPLTTYTFPVTISNTTPSTSKTTGALVVAGGAGFGSNISVGGNLRTYTSTGNVAFSVLDSGFVQFNTPALIAGNTAGALNIVGSSTGVYQAVRNTGSMIHVTGNDNTAARITVDTFGSGATAYPIFISRRARGTAASPTAVQSGDVLARVTASGWGTSDYALTAGNIAPTSIDFFALENFSSANSGSSINFYTSPIGAVTKTLSANITANVTTFSANVSVTGNVIVAGSAGISLIDGGTMGYNAGAGGTQTQGGNKSTGVTLNKPSGEITMASTALAAATTVSFTLTNSTIGAKDVLILNIVNGVATPASYNLDANCSAGSAVISVRNITAGSLSEAIVLRYVVIKGSTT
jgi:hypothetical protein